MALCHMGNSSSNLPPKAPQGNIRLGNSEFGDNYLNNINNNNNSNHQNGSMTAVSMTRQGSSGLTSVIGGGGGNGSVMRHDEPEVDYDSGATELYKRIEGKDWDGAMAVLEKDPMQARIWISRKEAQSSKIRWRLLPLHATCIFRSPLSLIELLIASFPDGPQMKDDQGMLPVHLACRNGASKGVVLTLLNAFPESINVKDRKGRVPLGLVETSASQNKEAVYVAMKRFQQEMARGMTFRSGNSIVSGNGSGGAPEMMEVDYENRTILFRLIIKKEWSSATSRVHAFPDEANTWIVTKGFNGNLRFLPIHKACVLTPPVTLMEALVAANPESVKSRDQDGWLPIHCACFYGASEAVVNTLLVAYPKGAQCKDDDGRLPIHYATLKCAPEAVIEGLLKNFPKGAMSKDDEGRLPIHHACSKGAAEGVIDALLKASPKGAQSKDDQGRLPLHHACRKTASERVIRTLLRVYPRAAQIKDDQEKLPIHYACQNGSSANIIHALLTTYPESINVKNGFGYTPLAEARSVNSPKMDPVIAVLEKFKLEQDKIKESSEENTVVDAKMTALTERLLALESSLHVMTNLGKDLKANIKKTKDPLALLSNFAEKLSSLDVGIESLAVPASQVSSDNLQAMNENQGKKGTFRNFIRNTSNGRASPRHGLSGSSNNGRQ
jgi:ankyrin repeat protein